MENVDPKGQSSADLEDVASASEEQGTENQQEEKPQGEEIDFKAKLAEMEKKVGLLIKENAKYRIRAKETRQAKEESERLALEKSGEYEKANEILKKSLEAERAEREKLKTQFTVGSIKKQTIAELAKKGAVDPEAVFKTLNKEDLLNVEVSENFEVDMAALAGIVDQHVREKPYFFKSQVDVKTAPAKPGNKVVEKEFSMKNWRDNAEEIGSLLDDL